MVLARNLHRGQGPPLAGGGVPLLGRVDTGLEVEEILARGIAARGEDRSVGEHGEIVLPTAVGHLRRRRDLRRGPVDVDDLRVRRRLAAARDEHPPDVEQRMSAVVAVDAVALSQRLPGAGAGRVQRAQRLVGTG